MDGQHAPGLLRNAVFRWPTAGFLARARRSRCLARFTQQRVGIPNRPDSALTAAEMSSAVAKDAAPHQQ
jgi:hypothetical protein